MTGSIDKSPYADNVVEVPDYKAQLERYPRRNVIEHVRGLSQVNGWRTTFWLLVHWGVIVACITAAVSLGKWWGYVAAICVIATRQQALGVMLHDATHYLLYRNRTVNDSVSDLFIAFPLGLSTDLYRATHFRHHLYTNTSDDPDLDYQAEDPDWFNWPKTKWGFRWVLVRSLLGLNLYKGYKAYRMWSPWMNIRLPLDGKPRYPLRSRVLLILSTIAVYTGVWFTGHIIEIVILWGFPGLTLLNFVNRLRATAEHIGAEGTHELNSTRTVLPTLLERVVVSPMGVNYHIEHHLFPSVPGHNLAKLHRILMADEAYSSRAHITRSYVGVLKELMMNPPVEQLRRHA